MGGKEKRELPHTVLYFIYRYSISVPRPLSDKKKVIYASKRQFSLLLMQGYINRNLLEKDMIVSDSFQRSVLCYFEMAVCEDPAMVEVKKRGLLMRLTLSCSFLH